MYGYDDRYDDEDEVGDDWKNACDRCGPWCEHWGGDGLCELVLDQMAREDDEFYKRYVSEGIGCPVCGMSLTEYRIPVDKLWLWPGGFYNPMIALDIYLVMDASKGEIHGMEMRVIFGREVESIGGRS